MIKLESETEYITRRLDIRKIAKFDENKYFQLSHLFQFIDYHEDLFYVNTEKKLEYENIRITYGDADKNCILITELDSDRKYNIHIISSFNPNSKEKDIGKKIKRLNLILGEQNYDF